MKERRRQETESREYKKERRKYARYPTSLPVKLEIFTTGGKHILNLVTSNVCAGGAFCDTDRIFPIGAEVKVSLLVQSESLRKMTGSNTLVKVNGRVARCASGGMAIRFHKDYTIQKVADGDWQL